MYYDYVEMTYIYVHVCTSIPYICQQQVKHRKQFQLELTLFRDRLNPKEYVMFALLVLLTLNMTSFRSNVPTLNFHWYILSHLYTVGLDFFAAHDMHIQ